MVTAILGAIVFGERLGWTWWIGAALLAAGNVVIGRREEKEMMRAEGVGGVRLSETTGIEGEEQQEEEAVRLMAEEDILDREGEESVADIIDLGDEDLVGRVGDASTKGST